MADYICNILSPDFDYNLHQSVTFSCAQFKQNLFGASVEILSFEIILNLSKVERLQQKYDPPYLIYPHI